MRIIDHLLKHPVISIAFWFLIASIGIISYNFMPIDLFPDTMPPQITAMTMVKGVSAEDVNRKVTALLDREFQGLTNITKVVSTSKDEISSVNAQFAFGTDMSTAMTDITNAVSRVKNSFPPSAAETQFFRITDANRPVVTISLSPQKDSSYDLKAIRILAENDIKEELLRAPGIGKADIFGANETEVLIRLDLNKLRNFRISPVAVLKTIGASNTSLPAGYLESNSSESLVKVINEVQNEHQLLSIPVKTTEKGVIALRDVAQVTLASKIPRSIYRGNAKNAIAINVLKPEKGFAVDAINAVKEILPHLQKQYPEILFEITTDQEPIISVNVAGMKNSLFSAVWLTMIIVFILLKRFSASLVVG
ncbi:MAG: efflux RND transporter permease subunit, partial [Candidatus Riflebacteria bacterium]|nr:efflux RND transporter permease subunit [Candidatus Riflebacteria bacterium]